MTTTCDSGSVVAVFHGAGEIACKTCYLLITNDPTTLDAKVLNSTLYGAEETYIEPFSGNREVADTVALSVKGAFKNLSLTSVCGGIATDGDPFHRV